MTDDSFRTLMTERWREFDRDERNSKQSNLATIALANWYANLSAAQRARADKVFAQWVQSTDEAKQFDALAMIRRFLIDSAIPSLKELRSHLDHDSGPGAPFLRAKVDELLELLRVREAAGRDAHRRPENLDS